MLAWQDLRLSENQANILHFNSLPLTHSSLGILPKIAFSSELNLFSGHCLPINGENEPQNRSQVVHFTAF